MSDYIMMIWDTENITTPALGDLFCVMSIGASVLKMDGSLGTHIELEPYVGDKQLAQCREEMQKQSDEVQAHWLSPAETEGLRRQLAHTKSEREYWLRAHDETQRQLAQMEILRDYCLRRTEALDAAEAALNECRIGGIYDEFNNVADAVMQMAAHIKELQSEHDQLVDRVEDAMGQIEKYDAHLAENHIQYAVEGILARLVQLETKPIEVEITGQEMVEALRNERALRQVAETGERAVRQALSQAMAAQSDAELTAHVSGKSADELAQTVHTVRQLRQGEERRAVTAEARVDHLSQALNAEVELRQKAEQRAECAEALAALVTIKVAELLERLANHTAAHTDSFAAPASSWALLRRAEIESARTLAARIREVLV